MRTLLLITMAFLITLYFALSEPGMVAVLLILADVVVCVVWIMSKYEIRVEVGE